MPSDMTVRQLQLLNEISKDTSKMPNCSTRNEFRVPAFMKRIERAPKNSHPIPSLAGVTSDQTLHCATYCIDHSTHVQSGRSVSALLR